METRRSIGRHVNWKLPIISLQILVCLAIAFNTLLLHNLFIITIRQILVFIYLSFVPGFLILLLISQDNILVFKLNIFILSVCLSLSVALLVGFVLNFIFYLSTYLLFITYSLLVGLLFILTSHKKLVVKHPKFNSSRLFSYFNYFLFLLILVALSILSIICIRYFKSNSVFLILLLIISVAPIIILRIDDVVEPLVFPLSIWVFAFSLLMVNSLFTPYLWGADIHHEYHYADLVLRNRFWNPSVDSKFNSMLSVSIVPVLYSILCNMSLTYVLKIIYPTLFSLVPVGLYFIYSYIFRSRRTGFLSAFAFISIFTFYHEMLYLTRQQLAELFLVGLLLVLVTGGVNRVSSKFVLVLLSYSLIVSHYSTSYFFLLTFLFSLLIGKIVFRRTITKYFLNYVFLYFSLMFGWYIFTARSASFSALLGVLSHAAGRINSFFNPAYVEPVDIVLYRHIGLLKKAMAYVNLLYLIIAIVGLIFIIKNLRRRCSNSYSAPFSYILYLSLSFAISFWSVLALVPDLTYGGFGATRVYHLMLFLLSPFFFKFFDFIKIRRDLKVGFILLFLVIMFLLNSGFMYELAGYGYSTTPLSYSHNWSSGRYPLIDKIKFYCNYFCGEDVASSRWIGHYRAINIVRTDLFGGRILESYGGFNRNEIRKNYIYFHIDYTRFYIYLRKIDCEERIFIHLTEHERRLIIFNLNQLVNLNNLDQIYTNGGSKIYYK